MTESDVTYDTLGLCDVEHCEQMAVTEYFVRWTDNHRHFNVWRACLDHQTLVQFNLINGVWSGGCRPAEFRIVLP